MVHALIGTVTGLLLVLIAVLLGESWLTIAGTWLLGSAVGLLGSLLVSLSPRRRKSERPSTVPADLNAR